MRNNSIHPRIDLPVDLMLIILEASFEMGKQLPKAFKFDTHRPRSLKGCTLRPGDKTPLWNELRAQISPHLRKYGQQVHLGRVLGLPRQRINAFVTGGGQMPDAERTLQLLAWLLAVRRGKRPI